MAKSGMNPKVLQYLMGHSDAGTTLNVYSHTSYEKAEKQMFEAVENRRKEA
jgi:integrase